jgi:hypothetical protein
MSRRGFAIAGETARRKLYEKFMEFSIAGRYSGQLAKAKSQIEG